MDFASCLPLPGTIPTNKKLLKLCHMLLGKFKRDKTMGHMEYVVRRWLKGLTPSAHKLNYYV